MNQAKTNGATPLFIAAQEGHLPVVKLLLDREAAVNQAKTNGATPLFIVAQEGHGGLGGVSLWIKSKLLFPGLNWCRPRSTAPIFIAILNF